MVARAKLRKPKTLIDCFPDRWTPRQVQIDALNEIEAVLAAGKRFIVLEGPPGSGKSLLGVTLARYLKQAYVCTLTKILQAQYLQEFSYLGMKELKGRSNFHCADANNTCEVGGHLYKNKCMSCPYQAAKAEAFASDLMICNYHSLLYNVRRQTDPDSSETTDPIRPLLICDEAHSLERVLMDHVSVYIDLNKLPVSMEDPPPVKSAVDVAAHVQWLETLLGKLKFKAHEDPDEQIVIDRLRAKIHYFMNHRETEEWIVEQPNGQDADRKPRAFSLKPLTVKSFGDMVLQWGERVLLMSATILDHESFCRSLGIDVEQSTLIRAPCTFPVANRPIHCAEFDMTFKARALSWPLAFKLIGQICNHHRNEKGLILCQSDQMIRELVKVSDSKLTTRFRIAVGENRAARYSEHLQSKAPTILVGSNLWEGVDLKDDHSRFQIIPAAPFPPWEGQTKERARLDPGWYRLQAMIKIVQGAGRSVRSESDSACTYILDRRVIEESRRAVKCLLPDWFKDAMVTD